MTNYYGKCSQWRNELETEIINKSNGIFDRDDFDGSSYIAKETEEYFNLGTQKMFNQTQWLSDNQVDEVKKYTEDHLWGIIIGVIALLGISLRFKESNIVSPIKKYKEHIDDQLTSWDKRHVEYEKLKKEIESLKSEMSSIKAI